MLGQGLEPEIDSIRPALEAKLQGQYRIIRQLGRGGMGRVYLARDLTLEREVAIKVISTEDHSPEMYDRFRREARTAAQLSHPHIVPLHAFGEVDGMPYFVMGYVRGESLAERLRRDGRLPEDDARRIFRDIADALDHAHRQGIIHRDVKPDNILLDDESGRALLTDFGIAKPAGTLEAGIIGTPQFMSPEQAAGRSDLDHRSDIYSLGVVASRMVNGHLSHPDLMVQAIERCLQRDPADRWPDAHSLKLALGVGYESPLPDALHAVEGKGVPALMITLALMDLYIFIGLEPLWFLQCWMVAFFLIAYTFVVVRLRREGFTAAQAQTAIWREPGWWLWWYPRVVRRRGNVWDRLPLDVRLLRWSVFLFTVFVAAIYVDITFGKILYGRPEPRFMFRRHLVDGDSHSIASVATFFALCSCWILFTSRSRRLLQRGGLNPADVSRVMLTVPPGRASYWSRPHIAAILATEPDTQRLDTPQEQLRAILRDANELSGSLRVLGNESAVAARHLLASLDTNDAENRERQLQMLTALASQVASLRAQAANTPQEIRAISDRVRALCEDIASSEVRADEGMATLRR